MLIRVCIHQSTPGCGRMIRVWLIVFQCIVFTIATLGLIPGGSGLKRETFRPVKHNIIQRPYEYEDPSGHSKGCGVTLDASTRLVGGSRVSQLTYPWFVILHRPGFIVHSLCGGALISDRHVVTAAHCFDSVYDHFVPITPERLYQATLGLHDRCAIPPTTETYDVARVIVHENFVTPTEMWDIALITLDGRTGYTPVCLPLPGVVVRGPNAGLVVGFGVQAHKAQTSPCVMHEVVVDIFTAGECARTQIPYGVATSAISFCAGVMAGGVDACQGDSGAPLVVLNGGRATLQGIVSFGYGCAREKFPGVYTSVPLYIDWIQAAMAQS